jgi:hypothetical protein
MVVVGTDGGEVKPEAPRWSAATWLSKSGIEWKI